MRTIVTAALQRQYLQAELILWIRLVLSGGNKKYIQNFEWKLHWKAAKNDKDIKDTIVMNFKEIGCHVVNWDAFIQVFELASFAISDVQFHVLLPEIRLVHE
jgi:hypothetical protein